MSNKVERPVKKISGFGDIPEVQPRTYRITRGDEVFEFEWKPLTFAQTEEIRARIPKPAVPMKTLPLGAKDLVLRAERGLPTSYPDENDPVYVEKMREYENLVSLESLRVALGWDMDPNEFVTKAKAYFIKKELDAFVDEVAEASFRLDAGLISRFLQTSNQSPLTEEGSFNTETPL